jgi:hypothetical protein
MTTTVTSIEELFRNPAADPVAEMRAQGLLPREITDKVYRPDPAVVQPASASALATVTPRSAYIAGRAQMSVSGPQWFIAGTSAEIGFKWNPGSWGSIVWFDFYNLGANRDLICWIELRVNPPATTTFRLGGTGNPTGTIVNHQSTGGLRTWVPIYLKSMADGRAIVFVTPTGLGDGGAWYSTSLYGF